MYLYNKDIVKHADSTTDKLDARQKIEKCCTTATYSVHSQAIFHVNFLAERNQSCMHFRIENYT
jgi:biotin carboxylase